MNRTLYLFLLILILYNQKKIKNKLIHIHIHASALFYENGIKILALATSKSGQSIH